MVNRAVMGWLGTAGPAPGQVWARSTALWALALGEGEGLIAGRREQALRCLPGVGPKSAQRMAYHLLQRDQKGATRLAASLTEALARIRHCARCNTFTEAETCSLCASARRDASLTNTMPGRAAATLAYAARYIRIVPGS